MKKVIGLQAIALISFCLIFLSLQNPTIYKNSLGLVSDNWQNVNGERTLVDKPYEKLTNDNYIQWDAKHYYQIKNNGYDLEKSGGDYVFAFFPLFPLIWKLSSLPPIGILFLNYLFFSLSLLILLHIFSDAKNNLQNILISLSLPSIIIFFIPYTEALYMLMISIGIYGFVKKKYWIFFLGILLSSLTRPSYSFLLLSFVGVEFFYFIQHKNIWLALKNMLLRTAPLIVGSALVSLIQYTQNSGSIFKFIEVQKYWGNILAVPHNLRDWSHEGFAINIGVISLIFIPLFISILYLLYYQFRNKKTVKILDYTSSKDYFLVLSMIYLIGNALFIILFRGGSLHCLFRFTLCSPFFYILLYIGFEYIKHISTDIRFFIISTISLIGLFILGLANYSTYWNFSDFGFFVFIGVLLFWVFQDFKFKRAYIIGLTLLLLINLIWTTYLFNTYIINGWIFA